MGTSSFRFKSCLFSISGAWITKAANFCSWSSGRGRKDRGHVITLNQGEGLIFPTQQRPVQGTRGYYRVTLRHGVGTVTSGTRYSLGIIFHDAT